MPYFHRIVHVPDGRADQGLFHRAPNAVGRPRSDVPGGRRNDLVILDLAVLDLDPVAKRAANRLGGAPAAAIPFGRLDIPGIVQLEFAQRVLGLTIQLHAFMHARKVTQHHARPAELFIHVEDQRVIVLPGLAVLAAGDHLPRQRAGLETAVFLVAHRG